MRFGQHYSMRRASRHVFAIVILVIIGAAAPTAVVSQTSGNSQLAEDREEFGREDDQRFAKILWAALIGERLVGPRRIITFPIQGKPPHGVVQHILSADIKVDGAFGRVIVKANHRRSGATLQRVYERPSQYLTDYAVMFRRQRDYDTETTNWFWALFDTTGKLRTLKGTPIAGRVGRGDEKGCIGCHAKKGGRDYEALTAR